MKFLRFRFEVHDALNGTPIHGPGLFDAIGQRIGQIVAVPVEPEDNLTSEDIVAEDKRSGDAPVTD